MRYLRRVRLERTLHTQARAAEKHAARLASTCFCSASMRGVPESGSRSQTPSQDEAVQLGGATDMARTPARPATAAAVSPSGSASTHVSYAPCASDSPGVTWLSQRKQLQDADAQFRENESAAA